jgi:hypothetical protein|tara:strand:+ start:4306 stop:5010 length:705 start_codon:yes stop_codon:yes gene_type:complete
LISDRFEALSQAFRVFTEQLMRFRALFLVDTPEAVGNLDHAVDGILNAFHGLYDAVNAEAKGAFDFYAHPITGLVLWIRNARHHNSANRVRSIYRCARKEENETNYILVDFAAGEAEEGGTFAEYYVSWADILMVFEAQKRKYAESVERYRAALNADEIEGWCREHEYSERQIFVNLLPIVSAAGSACTGAIAQYITPESVEAETFLDHFQTVQPADFSKPDYTELTSRLFWPS